MSEQKLLPEQVLRAMALNYVGYKYAYVWDSLDIAAITNAADEIDRLRAELSTMTSLAKEASYCAKEAIQHAKSLAKAQSAEPVAWRMFDGEGGFDYQEDAPPQSSIDWCARYGRKFEALYTHPPAQQTASVPDGWKLVPVEPNGAMQDAGFLAAEISDFDHTTMDQVYRAMIAAAPEPTT